jgi:hypothetical protein
MTIELKDGRTLEHQTMAAKGSYENPLTREEEEAKALDLLIPLLGRERSRELTTRLWKLENIPDVSTLRPLYQC